MALCAGLLVVPGCYSYVPTEISAVPPGDHVRLLVTRTGSEDLARITESTELRPTIQGRFERVDGESLLLRVPVQRDPTGMRPAIEQVIRVPAGEVLAADLRRFDKAKTGLLVAAGAGGVAFLLYQVFDVFGDDSRAGEDPDLSIGIFSFPVGGR
jgi:hypothetical protein